MQNFLVDKALTINIMLLMEEEEVTILLLKLLNLTRASILFAFGSEAIKLFSI
jgi:hypothetical protein